MYASNCKYIDRLEMISDALILESVNIFLENENIETLEDAYTRLLRGFHAAKPSEKPILAKALNVLARKMSEAQKKENKTERSISTPKKKKKSTYKIHTGYGADEGQGITPDTFFNWRALPKSDSVYVFWYFPYSKTLVIYDSASVTHFDILTDLMDDKKRKWQRYIEPSVVRAILKKIGPEPTDDLPGDFDFRFFPLTSIGNGVVGRGKDGVVAFWNVGFTLPENRKILDDIIKKIQKHKKIPITDVYIP